MGQVLRLVPGSLIILLAITAEPGRAAEQQFSCNGDIIHDQTNPNPLDKPKPIDLNVTLGDGNNLSIKTGDGKLLAPRITSNNKRAAHLLAHLKTRLSQTRRVVMGD